MKRLLLRTSLKRLELKRPRYTRNLPTKRGLFRAVLDRYIDRFAAKHEAQLFCEEKSVASALADSFCCHRQLLYQQRHPGGLLHDQQLHHPLPDSGDIANTLKSRHAMQERTLQQFLCQRQARGEIPTHCDVTHLAEFLNCIIQGMSISAREGASLEN